MTKHKFTIEGFEMLEKVAADDMASSARIYVPKKWAGKKIAVIKLEE